MKALVYLAVRRLVNALRRVPGSPRLLLPVLFFGLLFLIFVGGMMLLSLLVPPDARPAPAFMPQAYVEGPPGVLIGAAKGILLLSLFSAVVAAFGEGSVFFTQSDIDFLFPAPLSQRAVLLFKMFGVYASVLVPTLYLPFLLGGSLALSARTTPLAHWPLSLGIFLFLLTTTNLTQILLLRRRDDGDDLRRRVQKGLRVIGWTLFALAALAYYHFAVNDADPRGLLRVINSELVSFLLFPVAWAADLSRVAFEGWTVVSAAKLTGLVLLVAESFFLLFAREREFYEGAMDVSARRSHLTLAVRRGDAGALHAQLAREGKLTRGRSLRSFGGGALAIVWKDLVSNTRLPLQSWAGFVAVAAFPALFGQFLGTGGGNAAILAWAAMFTLQMAGVFLLSLRDMLRRVDIMKALPISPVRLLLGELAVSMLLLTLLGWLSLGLMALLGGSRGTLLGVAFVILPTLAALMLLVQTVFVLLYPNHNDAAQKGMGSLLSLIGSTLALVPALVVGAALFALDAGRLHMALGVGATNLVAAATALALASYLWERFDPTD